MEFEGKHAVITPEGVFIIGTYDENGTPNAMNAAWGMQSDRSEITLMLGKLRPIIFDPSFNAYRVVGEIVGKAFSDGLKLK